MAATKQFQSDSSASGAPYQVPPEPNRWPAIGLAVGVHALLLAFLVIGINWQNHEPVAVEAEVWDLSPQVAAPPPPPPQPEPEPQPETPPPPPVPKAVEAPPPVEQPQVKQPAPPDIALEREKKRKEELKQQKLEEEQLERERELAQQKADEKKAKALADKKQRELAEQKAREEAQQKADELAKQEADKKKQAEKDKAAKEKADKLAKEKAQKADDARLAKLRDAEMKRMLAAADNVGTGSTGTAAKSAGPRRDNGYIAAITAKVKGNTHYGGDLDEPGNPVVIFHVEQLPTGDILSVKMTKSSGIPTFDDAVKRAIENSSPLPKKKDGTVERSLEINFHMKDMQ